MTPTSIGAITHLVLSHDDKYAFSAASDEKIVITDLHNKEIHHRLNKFYKGTKAAVYVAIC